MRYYSADWHLGHPNIIRYCNRPFLKPGDIGLDGKWTSTERAIEAAKRMNKWIIGRSNSRVKKMDEVKHVGDFCTIGNANGMPGERTKYEGYLEQLNGRWTLIEGNHDPNNKTKCSSVATIDRIGGMLVFVSHYPTDSEVHDPHLIEWVSKTCKFAICGHVHKSWSVKWVPHLYAHQPFLNINVGIDVRNFMPISDNEIVAIYHKSTNALKESGV